MTSALDTRRPRQHGEFFRFTTEHTSKPSVGDRSKYSDDPSYRIRQKVHFSSERLRSLLRKIDRFLAVTTEQRLHRPLGR